jgi:gas vesicle protein
METNNNVLQPQNQSLGLAPLLAGTLVGLLVGGITVLLTAPQPGATTRAELQQGVEQFRDLTSESVKEKVSLVRSKASQLKSEVQERAGHLQHQGKGLIIKQLDRVSQMAESGKKAIEDSAEHVVV